jgi:hypothetical protein
MKICGIWLSFCPTIFNLYFHISDNLMVISVGKTEDYVVSLW